MNGFADHADRSLNPKSHLGKRRRSGSTDQLSETQPAHDSEVSQDRLEAALQTIQRYDSNGSILRHRSTTHSSMTSAKRQRRSSSHSLHDSIEDRFHNSTYKSVEEVIADIKALQASSGTNGKTEDEDDKENRSDHGPDTVIEPKTLNLILHDLSKELYSAPSTNIANEEISNNEKLVRQQPARVLSLRSQTETGVKQLFSGLPVETDTHTEVDGRTLPNGVELTGALTISRALNSPKSVRTFGDVFAPHRNTKPLETPKTNRKHQGSTTISFVAPHTVEVASMNKFDYKHTSLSTGSWLQYSTKNGALSEDPKSISPLQEDPTALFKSSFSSFAPSVDHSTAIITEFDRSRCWWRERLTKSVLLDAPKQASETDSIHPSLDLEITDDFENLIENYVSEADLAELTESDRLLEEISELLETLYSYQVIRDSSEGRPFSSKKPSDTEISTYNMLRDQLGILVAELPPFALAKLDGEQLQALNISTNIFVAAPEYSGTSQADDSAPRRSKPAQPTAIPTPRQPAVIPTRNSYTTPAASYNSQNYNRNAAAAAYSARAPTAAYNTPRAVGSQAAPYSYQNYRAPNSGANATIQQYQRAAAAAAAAQNYNQNAVQTAQSYLRQPSQPNYQQRAQDNGTAFVRNNSPHIASTAVHTTQQEGQYNASSQHQQTAVTQARQSSGTPQPVNGVVPEAQRVSISGTPS